MYAVTLNELPIGECAVISSLNILGNKKLRLMDLGFVEGKSVVSLHKNYSGDPIAYKVRGTVIALRNDDAKNITVFCDHMPNKAPSYEIKTVGELALQE